MSEHLSNGHKSLLFSASFPYSLINGVLGAVLYGSFSRWVVYLLCRRILKWILPSANGYNRLQTPTYSMKKPSRVHLLHVSVTILLFLLVHLSFGQRPKVGLTLSGGGAKGLAHIGILKAIDSAGLKINYLTGTSMGAVVGSLYAAGYSGKDIERIAQGIDWNTLFSNSPKYKDIALREKDEFGGYLLEVSLHGLKPAPSSGFIDPQTVWVEFLKHLYPVYAVKDFHQLNIPFECIATDLETGKPVVLNTGELVPSIRSSMAIPSFITPVSYQGKVLVDGGLVQNFPVRHAKKMGATYLIGVSLYPGLMDRHAIKSALNVMDQVTSYVDAADEIEEKAMCDLLILPPIGDYNAASFGDAKDIIRIGNQMGEMMYPTFKHLADSLNAIEPIAYNPYTRLNPVPSVTIDSIEVVGISETTRKQLLDNMSILVNKTYTARKLSEALKRAYASLDYKFIYYELYPMQIPNHVKIKVIAEESGSSWVKVGLLYNSFLGTAINLNYTIKNYRKTNSRSMVKLSLGDNFDGLLQSRLLYGLKNKNQLQGELRVTDLKIPIYNGAQKMYVYNTSFNRIDFSYIRYFDSYSGIGGGFSFKHMTYSPDIASDLRHSGNESHLFAYIRQINNSLNRKLFPTQGFVSNFEAGYVFGRNVYHRNSTDVTSTDLLVSGFKSSPYYKIAFESTVYSPVASNTSIITEVQLGTLLNYNGLYYNEYFVGGVQSLFQQHLNFIGLMDAQVITSSIGSVLLGVQTNVFSNVYLKGEVNYGVYDFIKNKTIFNATDAKHIVGFGVSAGYFVSKWPILLSFSYSPEMKKLYSSFSLGYAF